MLYGIDLLAHTHEHLKIHLKGLCHQFRMILKEYSSKAVGMAIWCLILDFFDCFFNL
jgi:hypothetical protein